MALNLSSVTSSLKTLLLNNNTTTSSYDISSGLTTRVQKIAIGDPTILPIANTEYPAVTIHLKNKTEQFSQIGRSGNTKRDIELDYQITPITYSGAGVGTGMETAVLECYKLSGNIENLMRNSIDMSLGAYVEWILPSEVEYGAIQRDSTYCQTAKINLKIKILST
jgi:hypothetical protein